MVVPPGEQTRSFNAHGSSPASTKVAVPSIIWAAYSKAALRGSPQAAPPSASASMNRHAKAGPEPATAVAASICSSGR